MLAKTVDVHEAQTRLSELLSLVLTGAEVILTQGNQPLARLVPVLPLTTSAPRAAGLHAGAIWTSDDFDEPLPDEFWTGAA
jgi:prevent-host-death family protein